MAALVTKDLEVNQGAAFYQDFIWKDSTGTPVDLTGRTAHMQVRSKRPYGTVYIDLTTANGGIILGGAAGTIRIAMTGAQTEVLLKDAVYDLKIFSGTIPTRFSEGDVLVSVGATHDA